MRPAVAISQGDPLGIGPEVVVLALADPRVRAQVDAVVFGDRATLLRAAALRGVSLEARVVQVGPSTVRPKPVALRCRFALAALIAVPSKVTVASTVTFCSTMTLSFVVRSFTQSMSTPSNRVPPPMTIWRVLPQLIPPAVPRKVERITRTNWPTPSVEAALRLTME